MTLLILLIAVVMIATFVDMANPSILDKLADKFF